MADDDFSKLSRDLSAVPAESGKLFRQAIEVTARNIKDTARENSQGIGHAPHFPRSITYDISAGVSLLRETFGGGGSDTLSAEIGPDKDRPQGDLGNLIEYGSVNNPPQGIMHGALQANEADFARGIEKATDDALRAAGL